jgi:hypothetical protein
MTVIDALTFVRTHGVVLESARGPVPSLAHVIAGERIRGSWWSHPKGTEIFALTRAVRESPDVLVCRLVDGKVTYVHRRLWPALVRVCSQFPSGRLAQISERHTASGRHVVEQIAFSDWVSSDLAMQAARLEEKAALEALGTWCRR